MIFRLQRTFALGKSVLCRKKTCSHTNMSLLRDQQRKWTMSLLENSDRKKMFAGRRKLCFLPAVCGLLLCVCVWVSVPTPIPPFCGRRNGKIPTYPVIFSWGKSQRIPPSWGRPPSIYFFINVQLGEKTEVNFTVTEFVVDNCAFFLLTCLFSFFSRGI